MILFSKIKLILFLLMSLNPNLYVEVQDNIIIIDHQDGTYTQFMIEEISENPPSITIEAP